MRWLRCAAVLAAIAVVSSAGAATTATAPRPLLTYAVPDADIPGGVLHRGLCATDLRGHNYRISDLHAHVRPAWSRDGRWIAFTRLDDNPGEDHIGDIYVSDAAGHAGNITRDAGRGGGWVADWSPDGRRLIIGWSGWM